jgi:hypothetical protein
MPSLALMPIVKAENFKCVVEKGVVRSSIERAAMATVLIADFDKELDDVRTWTAKCCSSKNWCFDPSRRWPAVEGIAGAGSSTACGFRRGDPDRRVRETPRSTVGSAS